MGTEFGLLICAPSLAAAKAGAESAFARIAEVERALLSDAPGTDLRRLHDAAGERSVEIGPDLMLALRKGMDVAQRSDGGYDPTVGAQWRQIRLDPRSSKAMLLRPGVRLDLDSLARGYAVDAALAALRTAGAPSSLVRAGPPASADIAVGDPPPAQAGWPLLPRSVAAPSASSASSPSAPPRPLLLYRAGVSYRPGSITLIAPNSLTAALLADAVVGMGPQHRKALVDQYDGAELR